jgi:hypothetical protein
MKVPHFYLIMVEKIKVYAKYKILRHKAAQRATDTFSKEEIEILTFVCTTLRTSDSISVTSHAVKATKGTLDLNMEEGRLRVIDAVKSYIMDVKVGEQVKTCIKNYADRIISYRAQRFNKCCSQQISNLIGDFQS